MLAWLIQHRTTVFLAVLFVFVFGTQSYLALPREGPPDVNIPVVLVSTVFPGVSPEDVESLVSTPLENELASLKDVDKMKSTSAEGVSIVSLEFTPDVDIQDALQKVRERVSRARSKIPADAMDPEIREISFEDFPVLIVSLTGPVDQEVLRRHAELLRDDVQRIPGVLDVRLTGGLTRQIRVQASPERLTTYGLSLDDLTQAISQENANIPGGTVRTGDTRYLLRVPGEVRTPSDIEGLAIKKVGDKPVLVQDVARVVDGFKDRDTWARLNGQPAVSLAITKRTGANIVEIADAARILCDDHATSWPEGVSWRFVQDQSRRVKDMVSELQNSVLTALVLVVSVSFLALSARNSLFVALAIPLSLFVTFNVLEAFGITLNMIVLFSLILVLGMLLDDAIVVVENIYRHLEGGMGLREAAIAGTKQVSAAVISSTATTVAAFLPLVFWQGIMGEFMGYLPRVVIISLTASLGVAVLVMPAVTSRFMRKGAEEDVSISSEEDLEAADTFRKRLMARYRNLLAWSIDHRYLSALVGLLTLVGTLAAYRVLNHGVEFFPDTEPDRATLSVRAPDGTDLDATDRIVRQVEGVLAQEPDVELYVAETGVSGGGLSGTQSTPNEARISVQFRPHRNQAEEGEEARAEDSRRVIDRVRKAIAAIPGATITVERSKMGPPTGADVGVQVLGRDYHAVGELALAVQREIGKVEGVTDLTNDYRVGRPEMRLQVDRVAVKRIGGSTLRLAGELRTMLTGSKATAIRDGKDEYEVRVELDPAARDDLQDILALKVSSRDDQGRSVQVPLSSVASFELAGGSGSIKHIDQELVVTITGDVKDGFNAEAVRKQVERAIGAWPTADGYALRMGGVSEDQQEARAFLARAFLIGLALILVVLILHFDSLAVPVIILSSVILSLVGVLWGLVITGTPFGVIMTGLGVISLAGVVTKNAIVLLDYVKKLEDQGMPMRKALLTSGITRFRPVMLTAGAAVIGLIPMALGLNFDPIRMKLLYGGSSAEMWGPMAIAIIFGLTVATLLTLVMVPTFYSIWHDVAGLAGRILGPRDGQNPVPPPSGAALLLFLGVGAALLASPPVRAAEVVTLDEALAAAAEENLDLRLLAEATVQAETARGKAWALLSPTLSARGSYNVNQYEVSMDFAALMAAGMAEFIPEDVQEMLGMDLSDVEGQPLVVQEKTYWTGSMTASMNLFNGAAYPGIQAAGEKVDATRADEAATRMKVAAVITRLYLGLGAAREANALAEAAVKMAEDQQELARRQVAAGSAPERNALQAEILVLRARRDLAAAREMKIAATEAFRKATGLPPDTLLETPAFPDPPATLEEALERARTHRADIRAADLRASATWRAVNAVRWGWAPTVSGSFTEAWSQNTMFSDHEWNWLLTVSANWTLWDGGTRLAQGREMASLARSADLLVEKKRQDVDEEVRNAWARRQRALDAFASAEREVRMSEENLRLARTGFEVGSATWLDLETAELGLTRARMTLVQERMNRDLSAVDVLTAMGAYR